MRNYFLLGLLISLFFSCSPMSEAMLNGEVIPKTKKNDRNQLIAQDLNDNIIEVDYKNTILNTEGNFDIYTTRIITNNKSILKYYINVHEKGNLVPLKTYIYTVEPKYKFNKENSLLNILKTTTGTVKIEDYETKITINRRIINGIFISKGSNECPEEIKDPQMLIMMGFSWCILPPIEIRANGYQPIKSEVTPSGVLKSFHLKTGKSSKLAKVKVSDLKRPTPNILGFLSLIHRMNPNIKIKDLNGKFIIGPTEPSTKLANEIASTPKTSVEQGTPKQKPKNAKYLGSGKFESGVLDVVFDVYLEDGKYIVESIPTGIANSVADFQTTGKTAITINPNGTKILRVTGYSLVGFSFLGQKVGVQTNYVLNFYLSKSNKLTGMTSKQIK
ncbi:hypothetical protein EI427_25620 (plasmid) [Flammeovirga pectinis]|uniref:Lipoprotein n=1 Tax=Flammeovirga pectinis TaxID=2494373 RepID=A0A3S9PBR1_9BACT|nr:hypothetical protein [Flammeovirga pectinis]AZQ65617.1 hypothetical protein EI427_25620 [Flammeovirga pectinis]